MGSGSLSTGFSGKSTTLQQSSDCSCAGGSVKKKKKLWTGAHSLERERSSVGICFALNETVGIHKLFLTFSKAWLSLPLQCWNTVGMGRYV